MRLLVDIILVAAAVFSAGHLPGIFAAMRPAPAPSWPNSENVQVSEITLTVPAKAGAAAQAYPARSFALASAQSTLSEPAPLVIYMPAWGGQARDNDVLLKRIASRGFLVLAVHDVAHDAPDGGEREEDRRARAAPFDLTSPNGIGPFLRGGDLKAEKAATKIARVIEASTRPLLPGEKREHREVDPLRIAAIGFSFGGSAAAAALYSVPLVKAAINLDGWIFGAAANRSTGKPYLAFRSTNSSAVFRLGTVRRNELAMDAISNERQRPQLTQPGSRFVSFPGTLHDDFSDGLHGAGRWKYWRPWRPPLAKPHQVRSAIDDFVLNFLTEHLGQPLPRA